MATEEDVFFTVHVVDDADELRQVPVPIKNHTSCKCVAQDDTFNSQPNDKTNSNDSKFPTIAIICGLICCFLSFLIAVAVLSLMKQLKEKRKGVLFNVAVTPQTSSIGIDMTQTCKNASL